MPIGGWRSQLYAQSQKPIASMLWGQAVRLRILHMPCITYIPGRNWIHLQFVTYCFLYLSLISRFSGGSEDAVRLGMFFMSNEFGTMAKFVLGGRFMVVVGFRKLFCL